MFNNKKNKLSQDTLQSLRKFNAKLKFEQRLKYVQELDRLADIDLQNIHSDVADIKNDYYNKLKLAN